MKKKMILLGYERKKGNFQGIQFDNFNLYLANEIVKDGEGLKVDKFKIKASLIDCDLSALLNTNIDLLFDRYGKVVQIKY